MKIREMMILPRTVSGDQQQIQRTCEIRQAARQEIVRQVAHGMTAREARLANLVPMHRTTVYRLLKRVEREGEQALTERRHGHPVKLRGEVRTWTLEYCRSHSSASSTELQRLVTERFGLAISVSQLNRVRAAHGLSRKDPPREKKAENGRYHCLWIS
ncbi:MAG TPA: helix-turn-helix domain-containing protein [Ktedonobacteraceae bacterium]|jgi:transposase|nr:helix-turn-helix domain-containing protein [Ktedonobacteraceae bacterium]